VPRIARKLAQTFERIPKEMQRFHGWRIPVWI
jgi:hypothetical protein